MAPRAARTALCAALAAVLAAGFPENRADCDSSNRACIAGDESMALDFQLVTEEMPVYEWTAERGVLNPDIQTDWSLPDGYEIDYTGGYVPPPADYVAPTRFVNSAGQTAFIELEATVAVTDAGFVPENISVLPGTTVTWDLQTFETASVRSTDGGVSINSGPINRNWAPTFQMRFDAEAEYEYHNDEVPGWKGGHNGRITVSSYNCSSYASCTTCLIYPQCMWCPGNVSCIERNVATNMPLDDGVVAAIPFVQDREYQFIRFMEGYSLQLARMVLTWFPWPPIRRNPKPVPPQEVPAYLDPVSSDQCTAYMRTRDAATCDNYIVPPPKNRVTGIETDRPQLDEWSACYEHVIETWAKPDMPPPVPWQGWPAHAHMARWGPRRGPRGGTGVVLRRHL